MGVFNQFGQMAIYIFTGSNQRVIVQVKRTQ